MYTLAIRALVALALLGGVFSAGHHYGYKGEHQACEVARLASVERAVSEAQVIAKQDAEVSAGFETAKPRIEYAYRTVEKEIVREIPANCAQCRLTAAGLGLLNAAIAGSPVSTGTLASQLVGPVRAPEPFEHGDVSRDRGEAGGNEQTP